MCYNNYFRSLGHTLLTFDIINSLQVMYARKVDQRSAVFQKAIEVGDAYVLRTKVSLNFLA